MDGRTRSIRENVILLLVQANPDGMTRVADWYMKHVGTPYETSRLPVLYHQYAGHDNNRDTFMANLLETQNMNRIVGKEWFPQMLYVQHETAPFPARIWIPPNPEPVNPNLHPMVTRWKNLIGSAMGQGFEGADQPGAISRTAFDLWYPGYADGPRVEGHNIPTILTETANYRYELLYYKYKMGQDVIERFNNEPPYGWIIPLDQNDVNAATLMLNRFMNYGIEVYRSEEAFTQDGLPYPRGSFIVDDSRIDVQRLREIASATRIVMRRGNARVGSQAVNKSRIGLYKSWVAQMDAGWISYILDLYDFQYSSIHDADVKAGHLKNRFDVLILPDQGASSIIQGHRKGTMPPDYVGGIALFIMPG